MLKKKLLVLVLMLSLLFVSGLVVSYANHDHASSLVAASENQSSSYIGNSNSMKFHYTTCTWVGKMNPANKVPFATRDEAISAGYVPCKVCKP